MVFAHSWRKKICQIGLTVNKSTLLHYTDTEILNILRNVKTIAMVGASANAVRPSSFAMKYLLGKGYDVIPINPKHAGQKILGQVTYNSLSDVPRPIDMVDIFRSSEMVAILLEEILTIKSQKKIKVVWMQLGVRNDKAAKIAKHNDLQVIMDRCPKIEYGRLFGELSWCGVNTGIISSKRRAFIK